MTFVSGFSFTALTMFATALVFHDLSDVWLLVYQWTFQIVVTMSSACVVALITFLFVCFFSFSHNHGLLSGLHVDLTLLTKKMPSSTGKNQGLNQE